MKRAFIGVGILGGLLWLGGNAVAQDAPPPPTPEDEAQPPPPEESEAPPTRIVAGLVERDDDGSPVGGATVTIVGTTQSVITEPNGLFALLNVPADRVELRISGEGVQAQIVEVLPEQGSVRVGMQPLVPVEEPPSPDATSRSVSGQVTEAGTDLPISGAAVVLQGTSIAAITDEQGRFTLEQLPLTDVELEVTSGFHETRTVLVPPGRNTMDVELRLITSEQIIITGRAPQIVKQNLANGASVVQSDDLNRVTSQTLDDAMAGKVAGANIQRNSGAPGGGVQVRMRGVSTINGRATPLYVIDGVIISNVAIPSGISAVTESSRGSNASSTQDNQVNRIADLNPNDIESIEVLKGASAAALYGSKASNGVVIITTKRGKAGKPRVSVVQRFGFSQLSNTLGARTFTSAQEAMDTFGPAADGAFEPGRVFDHEEELFGESALATETIGSFSGGTNDRSYSATFLVKDQPGILVGTGYEKQTGRLAITQDLGKRASLGLSTYIIHSKAARGMTQNDNAGVSHYMVLPSTPSFLDLSANADGSFPSNPFIGSTTNPLQTVALMNDAEDVWRFIGAATASVGVLSTPNHALTLGANLGIDWFQQQNTLLFPPELHFEDQDGLPGTSLDTNSENQNFNVGLNAVYAFVPTSGAFKSVSSAGFTYEERDLDSVYIVARNLNAGQPNVDAGASVQVIQQRALVKDRGFFLQEEVLMLDESLSMLFAFLAESSSNNGDTDKLYLYPKASAAYKLPEMIPGVDLFRVRAAYGETGNQPTYGQKFTPLDAGNNIEGNPGVLTGVAAGDDDIEPERQREFEAGVDVVGWDGRAVVELTGYQKNVSNLILQRSLPPSVGFSVEFFNGGSLRNRGLELMVQVKPVVMPKFEWLSRTIFTLNRSQITDLPVSAFNVGGFGTSLGTFRIEEGVAPTSIYGNTGRDAEGNQLVGKVGDVEPDFRMSFVNNFKFGNSFGMTSLWDWQQGTEVINLTRFLYDLSGNTVDYVGAGEQRLTDFGDGFTAPYIEDGTFFKLREVSLYYNLPESVTDLVGPMESAQVSVSGRDLVTFTNYSGLDPEVSNFGNQPIARNIDVAPFPPSRSFWLTVGAQF
jgi:TonB-linked SusC/RagA family outer membrane protein